MAGKRPCGLVLGGGAKPRKRAGRPSDWTQAKANRFVEVLADTCNVTLAAQAIERSIANIYKQRARNAGFRAQWNSALATGYARLELMLLERALHGVEKTVVGRDGTSSTMREYPDRVALTLLRMHRDSAAAADATDEAQDYEEACERIVAKLKRLRERDETSGAQLNAAGPVETKSAHRRIELIAGALRRRAGATR